MPKACASCGARYPADALFCSLDGSPLTTSPGAIAAAAATDAYVGREILGHIEIRQLVGFGAMGRVYRAFQRGIDRDVAVKVLHRELSANQTLVSRFHREAKVASRLAHPNVVHVLLVGQLPDGAMYIVMEYLDGMSLQSALAAAGGAMPLPRALHIALQLSDAAGEAHAQGIVHRDIKPENVMLVKRADDPDFVKVLDFGIACVNWGEQSMATAAGLIFGTARYISPEGAQGEKVGPPGDVYSIATMLYQMLSGRTPFDGDQAVALLVQQIHDPPPQLTSVPRASYVPHPIAAVVMKNLSKRAEERASDARAFGRAILEAAVTSGLSAQDILARPSMGGRAPGEHASVVQMPSMQRTSKLQLEPHVAARLGGHTAAGGATEVIRATRTAYETPVAAPDGRTPARTEVSDASASSTPPGSVTTRWAPPANFEARLGTPPPSSVDATMDDQQATQASARSPSEASKPPSSVDTTLAGEAPAVGARKARALVQVSTTPRQSRGRAVIVVVCFLLGVTGMTCAWRAGLLGTSAARSAQRPIDRDDEATRKVSAWTAEPPPAPVSSVPPLVSARASATAIVAGAVHAVLDASNGKPGVGQPVDFSARVVGTAGAGRSKVDGPRFRISGPGIAGGTEVAAADDGSGLFRTTFTFLQGGRFEVAFSARADGSPVRAARFVQVAGAGEPAAPPSSGSEPSSAPAASAKWL